MSWQAHSAYVSIDDKTLMAPGSGVHTENITSPISKLTAILPILAITLVALVAACSGSDPTPTPTPTPTPSPIFSLPGDASVADFIRALPDDARACTRNAVGEGTSSLFENILLFEGNDFLPESLPLGCFSSDILADIVLAGLSSQTSGLTDESIACIRGTFQTIDIARFITSARGDFDPNDAGDIIGSALTLLLCLTDEEAENIELAAFSGEADGLSLLDLRCVAERVNINDLLGLFDSIDSGGVPNLSTGFEIAAAFQKCGADLLSISSVEGSPSEPVIEGGGGSHPRV